MRSEHAALWITFQQKRSYCRPANGGAVSRRSGFALNQGDVVLPVATYLPKDGESLVAGYERFAGRHADPVGVQPETYPLARQFTRHRLAVTRHGHQAVAGDPGRFLHIPVKLRWHGHHLGAFVLQHLGHAELLVPSWRISPQCARQRSPRLALSLRAAGSYDAKDVLSPA
jgi:hypothetical protein